MSKFKQKVFTELKKIPFGETRTYQEIANKIQKPKAVRAVASAIASNTKFYIIPCHRVIRSDGKTGEYRWGARLKAILIYLEKKLKKLF